jgi:ferric-dicitrate binding protein FerR (iron transport regulator)
MNEERYQELLGRLLDDELDSVQARELAEWLRANPAVQSDVRRILSLWELYSQQRRPERSADAFAEACKTRILAQADKRTFVEGVEARLRQAGAVASAAADRASSSLAERLRRLLFSLRWVMGGAVAVLIVALCIWLFSATKNEPTLAVAKGTQITLERDGRSFPAQDGLKLMPGDMLKTSPTGAALITYGRENTRVIISTDTALKILSWKEGKHFELRQGRIEATVARQPHGQPMVWRTAQAKATVVGTELALEVATNTTTLEVLEGKVELTSRSNGQAIQLTNSQYVVAAAGKEMKAQPFPLGRGTILHEYWLGVEGVNVGKLTHDSNYPNKPSGREYLTNLAGPTNWGVNYGGRFSGYLHVPKTGVYNFWITGSHSAQLFLSSDETPEHAEMVASLGQPAPPGQWEKYPWQKSRPITLQAGRKYYIEALHKASGNGGDYCSVAWQPPAGRREVIPGEFLSPFRLK